MKANFGLFVSQCSGKHPFAGIKLAKKVARSISRSKGDPVQAYRCPHCGKYHVGSSAVKKSRGMKFVEKHS